MKVTPLCLVLIGVIAVLASPVLADDLPGLGNYWYWTIVGDTRDSQNVSWGASGATVGFHPLAVDGWDGEPPIEVVDGPDVCVGSCHADWPGQSTFYAQDFRAPLMPGETKTWMLYLWATRDVPGTCDTIGFAIGNTMPLPPSAYGIQFNLTLAAKPDSVVGGPNVGTTWDLDYAGTGGFLLPMYRTDNGLTGYQFELTATAVPEPSSLLAVVGGIVCLGATIRRRRS